MKDDTGVRLRAAREHQESGQLEEAAREYRAVLNRRPDFPDAVVGLADVLEAQDHPAEALALLERVAARRPGSSVLGLRLADALHARGQLARATESYRRVVTADGGIASAWWGLGCALASQENHADAVEAFRRLTSLEPAHGMGLTNLGKSLFELGEIDAAIEAFQSAVPHLRGAAAAMPLLNIATLIPGSPRAGTPEIRAAREAWAATLNLPNRPRGPSAPTAADRGRPVRIGYVSAFFGNRNWMKPVWSLLRQHDRERFELHLFSDGPEPDASSGYVADARDSYHDVSRLSNEALARRIEQERIDLLIDLNAYSRPARLPLFLLRPAPVQGAWFNLFGPSGLPGAFDFLVGDRHVVPEAEEPLYGERIVRVEGSYLTFDVPYAVPRVESPPVCAGPGLTFGCLAPQYKITPEVVTTWAGILEACPDARLIVRNGTLGQASARRYLAESFRWHGIRAERLDLQGPAEHFHFLETYGDIDVALDTFPYNGGTTTMEALWQGVPVLTFEGDRWAARISASLLREAGLDDWVAADREEYVDRAIHLATEPATAARLYDLRLGMRDRLRTSSVCDTAGFARRMEALYLRMLGHD